MAAVLYLSRKRPSFHPASPSWAGERGRSVSASSPERSAPRRARRPSTGGPTAIPAIAALTSPVGPRPRFRGEGAPPLASGARPAPPRAPPGPARAPASRAPPPARPPPSLLPPRPALRPARTPARIAPRRTGPPRPAPPTRKTRNPRSGLHRPTPPRAQDRPRPRPGTGPRPDPPSRPPPPAPGTGPGPRRALSPAGVMESQCDYSMYFPAVPLPPRAELAGDPGRYRALPRRNHLYLGETVRFLLVLRCRGAGRPGPGAAAWPDLAAALAALASVSAGDRAPGPAAPGPSADAGPGDPGGSLFRGCSPLLTHGPGPAAATAHLLPVEEPIVSTDEVIFPLTISLDKLPPGTLKAKIVVTVWRREAETPEVRDHGYLRLLQTRAPGQTFREEQSAFKAQVSTLLTLLPPPGLKCRQINVAGKHLTVLKVLNGSSQEEISVWDVRILPNFNASYLPVMPDGSVLLVDNVCHQSGEVSMGSFCRLPGASGCLPCPLSALEEHNFLFQLRGGEQPPPGGKEGLEVPLVAVVQWSTPKLPFTHSIYTHYRLPSIRLDRPCFVMTAACESPVRAHERFTVTYTLINNLHDFLAVRLVWTPEHAQAGAARPGGGEGTGRGRTGRRAAARRLEPGRQKDPGSDPFSETAGRSLLRASVPWAGKRGSTPVLRTAPGPQEALHGYRRYHRHSGKQLSEEERRSMQAALDAIVCHTPLNNLGFSRKGSALTFRVGFQALRAGLFELSQHMKLKLQFTASVSHPPPEARPLSRKSSPSSPAVRDLVERHQASLGRSQSFSHQQPSRSHLMRSGSVMERRAITPPVASPVGRPLYLPPDKAVLSLDKIAKRECKVLVVEPVK
uniref:Trafficking protein particle complex subunit 14 n=1 Tax=Ornithorhynchus anatinus TaxID=9258 RepID=A0A6I8PRB1_ORNAN